MRSTSCTGTLSVVRPFVERSLKKPEVVRVADLFTEAVGLREPALRSLCITSWRRLSHLRVAHKLHRFCHRRLSECALQMLLTPHNPGRDREANLMTRSLPNASHGACDGDTDRNLLTRMTASIQILDAIRIVSFFTGSTAGFNGMRR